MTMEPNRVLTVHWKDHSKKLSQGLWNFFNKEYMVDTNVSLHGDAIKVHSLLLSIFIPTFNKINSNKKVKEVNLDYIANQKKDVQSLVEFIYTGRTTIAEDRIQYVRSLAQDLDFKGFESSIAESELSTVVRSDVENYSCTVNDVEKKLVRVTRNQSSSLKLDGVLHSRTISQGAALKRNEKSTDDSSKKPSNLSDKEIEGTTTATKANNQGNSEKTVMSEDQRRYRRNYTINYTRTSMGWLKCGFCGYETENKSKFKRHMKDEHEPKTDDDTSKFKRYIKRNFKCDKCNEVFRSHSTFWYHRDTSCGQDRKFVCNYCGHRTLRQRTLEDHLAAKHRVDLKGNRLEKNVKCTKCNFVCVTHRQLTHHALQKHNEKKYECPQCEYAATLRSQLKKHIRVRHVNERNYVCDICGLTYKTRGALNVHVQIKHHGLKKYKCNECDKQYVCQESYKIHISKHTGTEKLYVCHVCGRSCNKRYNLGTHMRRLHGLKIEPIKKVYAPRQNTTNEVESLSDNLVMEQSVASIAETVDNQLQDVDYVFTEL